MHVYEIFARYLEGRVPRLPWCENSLAAETNVIRDELARLNRSGLLTINSQPRVNGVKSTDPSFGWGAPGGYVYQKAYLEFFCSSQVVDKLVKLCNTPEFSSISFMAVDVRGKTVTNVNVVGSRTPVNAVTWGVFPNQQIVQPTVVDFDSFMVWKDEAFALWTSQWQSLYDSSSASWSLIQEIHDSYFLVNVVDNDFVSGDIFALFKRLA